MEVRKCSLDAYNPGLFSSSFLLQTACHTLGITEAKKGNVSRAFGRFRFPLRASSSFRFAFRFALRTSSSFRFALREPFLHGSLLACYSDGNTYVNNGSIREVKSAENWSIREVILPTFIDSYF